MTPTASRAEILDLALTFDPLDSNTDYTFEIRERDGTVLHSGYVASQLGAGFCGAAEDLETALVPPPPDITVTDTSPGGCAEPQGGTLRVEIVLCTSIELVVCPGAGPCGGGGDVLGESSTSVGAVDFQQSRSPSLAPGQIQHIVVLMMENRSFDHSLGWVPNATADRTQTYNTKSDSSGTNHNPTNWAPDYQGCNNGDPNHGYTGGRCEWNSGAADGWLFSGPACSTGNDLYAIGYYNEVDLPFYSDLASDWTVLDNYYSAMMAGTWANKIYHLAGDTDRLDTGDLTPHAHADCKTNPNPGFSELRTIFDELSDGGRSAKYYYVDVPMSALWGTRYLPISHRISQFYADAQAGTLPDVAFIDPEYNVEALGTSRDDHPKADIRAGQDFMNEVYEAIINSPDWPNTVFIINHDEWGGFFDHVDPKAAGGGTNPATAPCQAQFDTVEAGLRGFRTPAFLISPWAPRGRVHGGVFDHNSVLKLIEWNFGLADNLTSRVTNANNLASLLCNVKNTSANSFAVPDMNQSPACSIVPGPNQWAGLEDLARSLGFDLPSEPMPALGLPGLLLATGVLGLAGLVAIRWRARRP